MAARQAVSWLKHEAEQELAATDLELAEHLQTDIRKAVNNGDNVANLVGKLDLILAENQNPDSGDGDGSFDEGTWSAMRDYVKDVRAFVALQRKLSGISS